MADVTEFRVIGTMLRHVVGQQHCPTLADVFQTFLDLLAQVGAIGQHRVFDVVFHHGYQLRGNARMVDPRFKEGKPTMFICGNDEAAKRVVRGVLDQFG